MDIKDEIRSRLPIEQLVGQYCQLKKKGRNYVCVCPFHNDKNPSFLVSPDKGIGYCFACQSGGDIFSFIQKIENIDFPTAVKMLAEKAGVDTKQYDLKESKGPSKDEKQRVRECLIAAQDFYMQRLKAVPLAFDYVQRRGVTGELLTQFGIGYAPDSFSETYDTLLKKGFSRTEIVAAGLGVQKELSDQKIYDRFRHRIMFPISDAQGNIIGFGGRTLGDSDAKYVNSPESVLYNKSSVLFGLFQARDAIRQSKKVVLVEGYFDAISAHKAGVKNVVAVSGTALTDEHVNILKRYAEEIILCLDQDSAGQLAAGRAFGLLARAHLIIKSVTLPAKDPDELVQKDPALFERLIQNESIPYIDAVISKLREMKDIGEPSGKRKISDSLFPLLAALPASIELRAYIEKASRSFGMVESELHGDYRSWTQQTAVPKVIRKQEEVQSKGYSSYDLCLGLALLYPAARQLLPELIPSGDQASDEIKRALTEAKEDQSIESIIERVNIEPVAREKLKVLSLYCEESFPLWSEGNVVREFRKMVAVANHDLMNRKQMQIIHDLKEARSKGRTDEESKLLVQYQQLLRLSHMSSK